LNDNASSQHWYVDSKTSNVQSQALETVGTFVNKPLHQRKLAQWGIRWYREPLQLSFFFAAGVGLALGHHFMYANLEGQVVSDGAFSQEAIKQIGNAFVAFVLAAMKVAIGESYNQYAWTLVKKKPLKIKTLSKVFSLTSQLFSFWSFHLIREARFAYLLGALPWYIPL
jgi:hypothetical protein